jgi:hypothetical protein
VLLIFIGWIIGLTEPMFHVFGHGVSGKDLILAIGGMFLGYKATHEIHNSLEGEEGEASAKVMANFAAVVTQIALINLVFSIDSIVTAVGMANEIWIMAVAVILSMSVLMVASGPVATFVEAHPTVKILALGFLIMIGMARWSPTASARTCPRATSIPPWCSRCSSRSSTCGIGARRSRSTCATPMARRPRPQATSAGRWSRWECRVRTERNVDQQ